MQCGCQYEDFEEIVTKLVSVQKVEPYKLGRGCHMKHIT